MVMTLSLFMVNSLIFNIFLNFKHCFKITFAYSDSDSRNINVYYKKHQFYVVGQLMTHFGNRWD